jgi:hypothetical protein
MIEILTGINLMWMRDAFYDATLDVVEEGYVRWILETGRALFHTMFQYERNHDT